MLVCWSVPWQGSRGFVRIFKNKAFTRFADKAGIGDSALCRAVGDADRGLIAADLGGGVIQQRIARPGRGKSGGFRTLIVFKARTRAFFVYGFAKNEVDNIGRDELVALRKLVGELLAYDDEALAPVLASGTLVEVDCGKKTVP